MPKVTADRIQFIPEDRQIISEKSPGITPATYTTLFNGAIDEGDTTAYFKFLEEIYEKDPDVRQAVDTRSAYVTSKEWEIHDEDGNPDNEEAVKIKEALLDIPGDRYEGLLTFDQLIDTFMGVTLMTGLSFSEIVTGENEVLGFNYIPCHFLTFRDSVYYPKLWTQERPTGEELNRDKMISHYAHQSADPARGYLGNALAWQYVFKRTTLDARTKFERKYGKGFLLVNMPGAKDSFEENWDTAKELIENYSDVDGAVFEGDVMADFKESMQAEGDYFFNAEDKYETNIIRIVLGQDSTTSSDSSNRSTADVHMEVLEKRIMDDMKSIQDTVNSQLLPKVQQLLGIGEDKKFFFTFVMSEMEATLDEEIEEEEAIEEDGETQGQVEETQTEGEENE